jgi:hypothetical protein
LRFAAARTIGDVRDREPFPNGEGQPVARGGEGNANRLVAAVRPGVDHPELALGPWLVFIGLIGVWRH